MQFLFVMDPAETMLPDKDTTFAFVRAATAAGHECFHCQPTDVGVSDSMRARVVAAARPLRVSERAPHVSLGAPSFVTVADVDAVFVRKDPPFDTTYLHLTQLLDLVKESTLVINDPQGLQRANEKLFALRFGTWMPETVVTKSREEILAFVERVGGRAVLKPLDGAGGSGVVGLWSGDKNLRALVDLLTREGKEWAMAQAYQPAIEQGDKRVLLLAGQLLGAIRRVPRPDDLRANIHVGGRVEATTLTPEEQRLVDEVGPALAAHGLWFVGLDLIGERLIEVNVTSPTGIQELGRLSGTRPEETVIDWAVAEVTRRRGARGAEAP